MDRVEAGGVERRRRQPIALRRRQRVVRAVEPTDGVRVGDAVPQALDAHRDTPLDVRIRLPYQT